MKTQTRFLIVLSVILFLVAPVIATESIITEGINNTVSTLPNTPSSGSSDGTYPKNYGSGGGGGFYRATPTPAITDMPITYTETQETPLPTETIQPTPTEAPAPTETIPEVPGFGAWIAIVSFLAIVAMIRKH